MGNVLNIQRFCTSDGPGIRTTVFLKGCPLRCLWCHNPETQRGARELMLATDRCTLCGACVAACPQKAHALADGYHTLNRSACLGCAACSRVCPNGALSVAGEHMEAAEVVAVVARDVPFYQTSGGGVTLTGGEPLAQPAFAAEILRLCREKGIHTALETSGFADEAVAREVFSLCDLLLYDVKESDEQRHVALTGVSIAPIRRNLQLADEMGVPTRLRVPVVPGYNDREEHLQSVKALAASLKHGRGVEIMPYHTTGSYKYAQLDRPYACADVLAPDRETADRWRQTVGQK